MSFRDGPLMRVVAIQGWSVDVDCCHSEMVS